VDEGVTRIEGEGQGEPAAKRLKVVEDAAASNMSALRGQFVKVKQVPARGSCGLIAPDRTPSSVTCADLDEAPTTVDASERFLVPNVCSV